jgi:hypothetical protein
MLILKRSRGGAVAATLFLFTAIAVFAWAFFQASRNPADLESSFVLLPFTMPWISMAPSDWNRHLFALACVFLNALILYGVFGGLRFKRTIK